MNSETHRDLWVFIEQTDGNIAPVSAQLLAEGARLVKDMSEETQLCGIIAGNENDVASASKDTIAYGASKVYTVTDPNLKNYTTDGYTIAVTAAIREHKPDILLYGVTPMGRDLAPRVAARMGLGLTADCTRLDIKASDYLEFARTETTMDTSSINLDDVHLKQTKPSFGGKLMATMICPNSRPQMATVRAGLWDTPEADYDRTGEIIPVDVTINEEDIRVRIKSHQAEIKSDLSLADADIIVAGGRGLGSKEGFDLLRQLADKVGGVVAASGSAVDAGWIEEEFMIGQTGTIVKPRLYIACGISGSIQHIAGMEKSDTIIAINTDPDVPIFEIADYCIVGNLYEVVPALIEHWDEFKSNI